MLPNISELYRGYLAMAESAPDAPVRRWYGAEPLGGRWMDKRAAEAADVGRLADLLKAQSTAFGAGEKILENIERLRGGARALVTGQQVGLFGGPTLTLLKAATAIARAKQATRATGVEHVPVFWLATEDHDLEEIDQASFLTKDSIETLKTELTGPAVPVGGIEVGPEIEPVLARAEELLGFGTAGEWLREFYATREGYRPTLGGAFARLMVRIFGGHGLIVMDAAGREFHALGAKTLRYAIEHAAELEERLLARTKELEAAGYHAQVLILPAQSLLFLVDEGTGERSALKRLPDGAWKANGRSYSTAELLGILESATERLSPNALLRPVFQDTILPTAAYVGGPAEIAYFAQSSAAYEAILGRVTPVLPRLSATLIESAIATIMEQHEISLGDVLELKTADEIAQRLGARAMPIPLKRKLAAAGNALETELTTLTEYMAAMDKSLGQAAEVSGSKMLYQMNRLRRMAATHELQKENSLKKHAIAIALNLFPDGHTQERLLAGVWFLARQGEELAARLVTEAESLCPGHIVIRL
jgi:bacillithiol biosynthesis cysteine-adding enzyme BshC